MQMTPVFNPFQKVSNDPVMDAMIVALKQENESYKRTLAISEMMIQRLKEELRLERIRKYGKRSEKLSDLQLELLGHEPAVSSEEIVAESERSEEHTSELQSLRHLVCRLLLEKKKKKTKWLTYTSKSRPSCSHCAESRIV